MIIWIKIVNNWIQIRKTVLENMYSILKSARKEGIQAESLQKFELNKRIDFWR